ncbi:MAG TPA: hypothetical protein DCZ40_06835 [Lachnospiraceae bacterium]|nr:hypothetical protein [Lachnospiraceae bacterium]
MEIINFNDFQQNQRMYGGTAGRKMGITYNGKDYLLKFPGNLKEQKMKNINLSYSNSPVCEYIGSKIYELVRLPVHNTILGTRNGKTVVACEDFLQDVPGVKEHFWNMFIMDALIGNSDRNNSNWGIILRKDGSKDIAPVYDNGNCLNSKWDDEKMRIVMNDADRMEAEAYKARRCIFELHGKRINPYHIIESRECPECLEAVYRLTPQIGNNMDKIQTMIKEIPILSEIQKRFFISIIECRYEKVLLECIKNDCVH